MSIVKDKVEGFLAGVSQQTDKLISPHATKLLENHLPDMVEGLKRRPGSKLITRLCDSETKHPYIHTIIKEDEAYQVIFNGTACKIYDLSGNEKELYIAPNVVNYITTAKPLTDLYAVTLADYTFVLNRTKKVALKNDTYPENYGKTAIIFVKQGNFSTDYKVTINGISAANLTTSATAANEIKTTAIAAALKTQFETNLISGYTFDISGSTIIVTKTSEGDLTINCEDSNGNRNLFAYYKTADTSTDLPTVAPNGYILNIIQDAKDGADDYYVKFTTADGSNLGQGVWSECPKPGIKYRLDPATMPLILVRQADGDFTLTTADWGERLCGDEDTAASPSFIGSTIQEVLTHKGRLGLVSTDKIIFSDVNDIFSFFKKSILTELDTDPIDIASNSKMVLLKHTLPFNQELMLCSETSQFVLKGGDTFSNSTVSMNLATAYQCSSKCKPLSLGANGYFVYENGAYTRVMGFFITDALTVDAEDITEQCPSYLPDNVYKMAGSAANNTIVLLSQSEKNTLYVHNYFIKDGKRVQTAWHKWIFEGDILNADFDKHNLYLTVQYSDGIFLEVIDFTPKLTDLDLPFQIYLDRKFFVNTLLSDSLGTYFIIPYEIGSGDDFKVVDSRGFSLDYTINNNKCYVKSSHTPLCCGTGFTSKWQFPPIYVRRSNGQTETVAEGMLMLRDINLSYANSGFFKIRVEPKFTTQISSEFKFTGKISGLPSATLGKTNVESGMFLIPVIARNEDITIMAVNDNYLPCCYLAFEWIGDYVQRGH